MHNTCFTTTSFDGTNSGWVSPPGFVSFFLHFISQIIIILPEKIYAGFSEQQKNIFLCRFLTLLNNYESYRS